MMEDPIGLFGTFRTEARSKSQLYTFWDNYICMVQLLLRFIRAERTGNWDEHLAATGSMIPFFFGMDRPNYSRWLPVYVDDMRLLCDRHPSVHIGLAGGSHAVS